MVCGDVVDRVGRLLGRVDDDVAHEHAVEEGFHAEIVSGAILGRRAEVGDVDVAAVALAVDNWAR